MKMKFAVIGTSSICENYVKSAESSQKWELSAVYSRKYETGKAFAEKFSCSTVYTNLDEFSKSDIFNAVYVASPNVYHYEHVKILLKNKKHVICEKPLVSYLWQAKELMQIAEENHVIFMEAIMSMNVNARESLKNALSKIGNISMATFEFCQRSSRYDSFLEGNLPNIFNPELHAGALMDLGVYCIFPAFYLFGRPQSYTVDLCKMSTGVDASGLIILNYEKKHVLIKFSKIGQTGACSDIQGDFGTITIEAISQLNNININYSNGEKENLYIGKDKDTVMAFESINFYHFINGKDLEIYKENKDLSLLVVEYLEKFRKDGNLPF